jgi:hypothetical protein
MNVQQLIPRIGQLCHSRGMSGLAQGQPRARVPHLVGPRLPSPYHFRARIQSFQAVAAPFPGDVVLPSALAPRSRRPRRLRLKDPRSARRSPPIGGVGTNIEQLRNFGKIFVERLGSTQLFSSPVALFAIVVSNHVIFQLVMRLTKLAIAHRPLHSDIPIFRNNTLVAGRNSPATPAERGCRRAHACRVSPRALISPPPALGRGRRRGGRGDRGRRSRPWANSCCRARSRVRCAGRRRRRTSRALHCILQPISSTCLETALFIRPS